MFACEQEAVVPDLMCLGKGLSGGYLPLAATLANPEIYSAFLGRFDQARTLHHGHTFSGNPLAAAAGLAALDLFDEEQTLVKLTVSVGPDPAATQNDGNNGSGNDGGGDTGSGNEGNGGGP